MSHIQCSNVASTAAASSSQNFSLRNFYINLLRYSEYEFDHEFIAELRNFILMCVRRMNGGNGVTLKQIADKMTLANVSRVKLTLEEVQQLIQTLAFDYLIEQRGVTEEGEALFVAARKVTTMSEFGWWDVLDPDFHFRRVVFEDGVVLTPHEPHHHS